MKLSGYHVRNGNKFSVRLASLLAPFFYTMYSRLYSTEIFRFWLVCPATSVISSSDTSRMWSACAVTRYTCFVSYTLTRFFRLYLSYLFFTCLYIPRVHLKSVHLLHLRLTLHQNKDLRVNVDIPARLDEFSEMMYTIIDVMVYIFCISFRGREEVNSSRVISSHNPDSLHKK